MAISQSLGVGVVAEGVETDRQVACLRDLGVRKMRIITNNPGKRAGLKGFGLKIVDRVAIEIPPTRVNRSYLETKRDKNPPKKHGNIPL